MLTLSKDFAADLHKKKLNIFRKSQLKLIIGRSLSAQTQSVAFSTHSSVNQSIKQSGSRLCLVTCWLVQVLFGCLVGWLIGGAIDKGCCSCCCCSGSGCCVVVAASRRHPPLPLLLLLLLLLHSRQPSFTTLQATQHHTICWWAQSALHVCWQLPGRDSMVQIGCTALGFVCAPAADATEWPAGEREGVRSAFKMGGSHVQQMYVILIWFLLHTLQMAPWK